MAEQLADVGDGSHAYVDSRREAPEGGRSRMLERAVRLANISTSPSPVLQWAWVVATHRERLRGGEALGGAGWKDMARWIDTAYATNPTARDATSRS